MRKNQTLDRTRRGELAVGIWLHLHSIHAARMLAAQGCFHWMLVDMEHTPVNPTTAAHIFSTISDISGGRSTPLARVARGTIDQIKQALDAGAQGVIVPMVETANDAAAVVRYARFPPDGERGGGGMAPHLGFATNRGDYVKHANREILVGIQIETKKAIENLDSILDVPGLDVIFIGPNDLHMSLGLPARFWSDEPEFQQAVASVIAGCKARNLPYGTLCINAAAVKARRADGFTLLGMGSDAHYLLDAVGSEYGKLYDVATPAGSWGGLVQLSDEPRLHEQSSSDS